MAGNAGRRRWGYVHSRQGKSCRTVIERCRGPRHRRVAIGTIRYRKCWASRRVGRGIRLLPRGQMAPGIAAIGRRDRQSVVVVDVAQIARHSRMGIRQREAGRAVIKDSRSPRRNRVACGASHSRGREPGRDVIRYVASNRRGALESRLVAAVAIGRAERVVVVGMAGSAGRWRRGHVRPGQGKPRGAVVECCRRPTDRRVAGGTIRRRKGRSGCGMDWIIGLLPGGQMAAGISAIGWRNHQSVVVVDVTGSAGHVGMPIG